MVLQRGLALAGCVLVVLAAGQAQAQQATGGPPNETAQYLNGNVLGPLYHSSDDILTRLRQLASGQQAVSVVNIRDNITDSAHQMFRIMQPRRSPPSIQQLQQIPTAFIICNQHAREVIAAELCFWLVRLLAGDAKTLFDWPEFKRAIVASPVGVRRVGSTPSMARLKQWTANLTTRVKVEVVPIVNIDGRRQIELNGSYNLRKNPNGVDLNRNWVINRATPGSNAGELNPDDEIYGGTGPLTEWETRSLYNYMRQGLALAGRGLFIDIHSGMWALMSPWAGKFSLADLSSSDISASQALFDVMQPPLRDCNLRGIAAGPGAGLLYKSLGSADDTAKDMRFRQVLTSEIYGPIGNDPYVADSGWSYQCPPLKDFKDACNDGQDPPCGDTACRNRDGNIMAPMPNMRKMSLAAFVMASNGTDANINSTDGEPSTSRTAGLAAIGAGSQQQCPTPPPPPQPLNTDDDPFMQYKDNGDFLTFKYFNPINAAQYRDAVARWCAGMLLAIDNFSARGRR